MEPAESAPKFQSSLEKQGRVAKTWKKYWFVLDKDELIYVRKQDQMINSPQIKMAEVQTVRRTMGKYGYPFEIVTKTRTHHLCASTAELRDKWIKVLHDSMAWHSRRTSSSTSSTTEPSSTSSATSIEGRHSISDNSSTSCSVVTNRSSGYDSGIEDGFDSGSGSSCRRLKHQELRRVAMPISVPHEFVPVESCTSGEYDTVFLPEGLDLSQIHCGYLNVDKKEKKELCRSVADDPHRSGHASAKLAISHIMQGYVDIKRNPGPKSSDPDDSTENNDVLPFGSGDESSHSPSLARHSDLDPEEGRCSDVPSSALVLTDFPPILELSHPRLELTHRTAFDDIRHFLASNRGPDDYYSPVNRNELDGRHVKALKDYLATHCS